MYRRVLVVCVVTLVAAATALGATLADHTKLPLGDGKYGTSPKKGYVFSCITDFRGGGAFRDGPWIDATSKRWNLTTKIAVRGSVRWPGKASARVTAAGRLVAGNGLPAHATGVFPIAADDPAYAYDRNPNAIAAYTLKALLAKRPKVNSKPTCVGGTVGVMRNGIPLYSAFDAGGRDAPAHEIQDSCGGHPQITGQYHYHSLPPCLSDGGKGHSQLLGWALDGFGIYGPRGVGGKELSSADLDACHGHTHALAWNATKARLHHYHATYDFPYTVSCYRGTPITSATGLQIGRG